ncbi:uncharacterized protein Dyak_GE27337, partial [Drosophila yakuba]
MSKVEIAVLFLRTIEWSSRHYSGHLRADFPRRQTWIYHSFHLLCVMKLVRHFGSFSSLNEYVLVEQENIRFLPVSNSCNVLGISHIECQAKEKYQTNNKFPQRLLKYHF